MTTSSGLEGALSLPRVDTAEYREARSRLRRWVLIWLGCAALSWAATVIVGYSVIRFGDSTGATDVQATLDGGDLITPAEVEAVSAVAPAAGQ